MSHTFEITVSKKFEVIAETKEEAIELAKEEVKQYELHFNAQRIYSEQEQNDIEEEKAKNCSHYNVNFEGQCCDCDYIVNEDKYNHFHNLY